MRVRRGWSPARMVLAGFVMILIGAPLGVWVSAQRDDPSPTPGEIAVGGGDPAQAQTSLPTVDPEATIDDESDKPAPSPSPTQTPTERDDPAATAAPTAAPALAKEASPTATARPTKTPEPTATPEPTFDASTEPECEISATTAVTGQPLTLACTGFLPESRVRVYWEGIKQSRASFIASASGEGEATFQAPRVDSGRWYTRASDGDDRAATVRLTTIDPAMTMDQIVGQRDAEFTIDLTGFQSGEKVEVRWYGVEGPRFNTLRTPAVAADGSASIELQVPGSSATGRHRIAAVGLESGTVIETVYTVIAPGEALNFFQGTTGCNRIALIFNVGIGNPADPSVMDTLHRENVPATMFVMGWWPERFPESFQQIADGGFVIASHGYNAINLTTTGDDAIRRDVEAAEAAITAALGRPPARWFTPYAGTIDDRVRTLIASEGYIPVGWRVVTDDWDAATTADDVYNRVVNGAYDGAIVEFHLDGPTTASSTGVALPRIIETLRDRGYEFVTVPELAAPCQPDPDSDSDSDSDSESDSDDTAASESGNAAILPDEAALVTSGSVISRQRPHSR